MRLLRRRGTVRARSTGCPSASGASGRRAATTVAVRAARGVVPVWVQGGVPGPEVGREASRRGNCPDRHASEGWHPSGVGEMEADGMWR
jgi:hypothetical protein